MQKTSTAMNQQIILNGLSPDDLLASIRTIVNDAVCALPQPEKSKPFLTLSEAVELTGLSRSTIYRMTSQREIPHLKRGGKLLFNRAELVAWLQSASQPVEQ
jgi:excisionase family DNA binding protein